MNYESIIRRLFPALLLLLTGSALLNAANIFVLFDDQCMDRLEYRFINQPDAGPHVVFQFQKSNWERIILEIGTESRELRDAPPAQFISCGNAFFDSRLVEDINSSIHQVYVVVNHGNNRYSVNPVRSASYLSTQNRVLTYLSPSYRFQFHLDDGTIGEDISLNKKSARVYFEGKMENQCSGLFLFRYKTNQLGVDPLIDLVIAPEIGVIEERKGQTVEESLSNTMRLDLVDGQKLDRHLTRLCTGEPIPGEGLVIKTVPQEFDQQVQPLQPGEDGNKSATEKTTTSHTVKKGETLYGISRKYNVSVAQLRDWNSLGNSNLIKTGQTLQISASAGKAEQVANTSPAVSAGSFTRMPAPYETSGLAVGGDLVSRSVPDWKTTEGLHQVRSGETVASLAMKYGFTEARFRNINNLGPDEFIKIGQYLKTTDCSNCPGAQSTQLQTTYSASMTPKAGGSIPQGYEWTSGNNSFTTKNYEAPVVNPELPSYKYRPIERSFAADLPASYSDETPRDVENRIIHVVKEGESLFGIARQYGTNVERLKRLNNLEANEVIIPFQRLYIR
jgi:LysM repeat protein